jgi:CDP-diacylglycerol--glycerol-3-phosphate 3-phosphatidyltransferase
MVIIWYGKQKFIIFYSGFFNKMSLANIITLSRLPLLLIFLVLLFSGSMAWRLLGFFLLIILFLMDWFDGYVARRRQEVTELGAVLDVALDRAIENILWVAFLFIHLVPLWVPVLFLCRSFIVDSLRGVALRQGQSVFGMMHSPWGKFLVSSRFMRALYGFAKAWIFCQLTLTWGLNSAPSSIRAPTGIVQSGGNLFCGVSLPGPRPARPF